MDQKPLEASFHLLDPARAEQFAAELGQHLRFNEAGLIPAVAQDWLDGAVLMVAWMNAEAIERTLATGEVHYWSRSRQELWHKGATSGQLQKLRGLRYDCDADVLLLTIEQAGAGACHTGARRTATRCGCTCRLSAYFGSRHITPRKLFSQRCHGLGRCDRSNCVPRRR